MFASKLPSSSTLLLLFLARYGSHLFMLICINVCFHAQKKQKKD